MCRNLEYSEFEKTYILKARKIHFCQECQNNIFPGQFYFKATGKFDGEMYTYKRCDRCSQLLKYIVEKLECFCFGYGLLQETIDYHEEKTKLELIKAKYCHLSDRASSYYDNEYRQKGQEYGFYTQYYSNLV